MKKLQPSFFSTFSYRFHIPVIYSGHFSMLHMTIHVNQLMKCNISIKFKFQIQFVMFLRRRPGMPIDPAPILLSGIHCSTSHALSRPKA